MSYLGKLCDCSKSFDKEAQHLRVLFESSRANPNISASLCGSAEIHLWSDVRKRDRRAHKLKLQHKGAISGANVSWDAKWNLNWHLWPPITLFCKSLVFGFIDMDSFCYFNNIPDSRLNFIFKYLWHMVIYWKRPDHILSMLWGDIHDLSQILHYPANDSSEGKII